MKKLIMSLALLLAGIGSAQAQDVYNYLVNKANEKVNSAYANDYEVKKYDFELTALNYMKNHAFKENRSITTSFLDNQAYSLDTFLLTYLQVMKRTSDADKMNITQQFINASLNNPMYNDADKVTTQAYIEEKGCITPFSIDTDWIKALEQIKKSVK